MKPIMSLAAILALAMIAGDRAAAVTKLHDPVINHSTTVHGATNGNGAHRGPWVAQVAAAKGERVVVTAVAEDQPAAAPTLRVIAGNGSVYFGTPFDAISTNACVVAPVTGWLTAHVDIPGRPEQRFSFKFVRFAPGDFAEVCITNPH